MQVTREHNNNFNLIRLLAAAQVMIVHATNHFGYQHPIIHALKVIPGVPTFFFISGLLIFMSYDRMRSRGLSSFFVNRSLRIYPAMLTCLGVSVLAVYLTGYFEERQIGALDFWKWIASQATFFQFYNPDFMREFGVGVLNGALWTISVELQFYLLIPVLYYVIKRKMFVAITVFLCSLLLNIYVREGAHLNTLQMKLVYVSFGPWVYMFMLGCFVASRDDVLPLLDRVELKYLISAYILSMNFVGTYSVNASNAINPVSFVVLAAIILKVARMRLGISARVNAFFERNDFSYGLYLYHMPIINLLLALGLLSTAVNIAVAIVCSLLAAVLSWFLVEKPALAHKR